MINILCDAELLGNEYQNMWSFLLCIHYVIISILHIDSLIGVSRRY